MDQIIFASLSHTHYWYEVGMLKVPAVYEYLYLDTFDPSMSSSRARGKLSVCVELETFGTSSDSRLYAFTPCAYKNCLFYPRKIIIFWAVSYANKYALR